MKRMSLIIPACALLFLFLPVRAISQDLRLVPEPKQVQKQNGAFNITSKTRIVINSAHREEDRTAAETIAEEIESATGQKIKITTARSAPKSNAIYLARAGDDRKLSSLFEATNVSIDDKLGEEGYALYASVERVIIAARTGQGLFYGAQTLRQLIDRGEGHRATCQAVAIKDWPTMRWRGVHADISRGPVPTLDYMKKQIRTCAAFKLNMFSLYIEHTFDYQKHPLIAPKEGAVTADEVKQLVEYGKRYYVTIVPEQ